MFTPEYYGKLFFDKAHHQVKLKYPNGGFLRGNGIFFRSHSVSEPWGLPVESALSERLS